MYIPLPIVILAVLAIVVLLWLVIRGGLGYAHGVDAAKAEARQKEINQAEGATE